MVETINPYDKAHELARAITDSEVYKRYVAAKLAVEQKPDRKSVV